MINEQIRCKEVRVIGEEGQQLGVMALRDAFHYQLEEYIKPLEKSEYERFLGTAGDELERLMFENQDVLRRLKESE